MFSTIRRLSAPVLCSLFMLHAAVASQAVELAPFKDNLFSYPGILKSERDGRYLVVDYDEMRDINNRDQVPERRVWSRYVSLKVRRERQELSVDTPAGQLGHFAVGRQSDAAIIVVYVHGKGGSRKQGVDDYTFGGNFNRLMNLMVRNRGLYLSPDIPGFDAGGAAAIAALIAHYRAASPHAPLFVACGSLGGEICYRLAADRTAAAGISGFILLGAPPVESVFGSPAFARGTPFFFGHGSRDIVYSIEAAETHYRRFDRLKPGYPARFVRFETGTHGTPVRMTDWRQVLNWMLSLQL